MTLKTASREGGLAGCSVMPVSRHRRFAAWGRNLDDRFLGPGGLLPDGTSYEPNMWQTLTAPASPMWVRLGRFVGVLVGLAILRWGGDGDGKLILSLSVSIATGLLFVRADRDLRLAARAQKHV